MADGFGILLIDELKDKLEGYRPAIDQFVRRMLSNKKSAWVERLLEYNEENLKAGIRPDGSDIQKIPIGTQQSTLYERYTRYVKEKRGLPADYVTLYDTGSFYSALGILVGSDTIYFVDSDPKTLDIQTVWGEVLGITQYQLFEFIESIQPQLEAFTKAHFK